jgi:hypothetical protein
VIESFGVRRDRVLPAGALERRYRRLLLAYPGDYRRRHGAEIVTTLLEMAGPGQAHPTAPDAWHLAASGVRQRFRLPARRPLARVAAVLVTLIAGAFGTAAGSWAAEQTFTRLPDDAAVTALTRQAAGGGADLALDRSSSPWTTTSVYAAANSPGWTAKPAAERLAATGWHVTPIRDMPGGAFSDTSGVVVAAKGSTFDATRDGLRIHVTGYAVPGLATVTVGVWPDDTGALRPAIVAGGLLGLLAGWPLAAAGAYRMRRLAPGRRRVAATLSGLAVTALSVPAFAFGVNVTRVLRPSDTAVHTVHSALDTTGTYWSYGTRGLLLQLTIAGLVLSAAAWAVLGRRGTPADAVDRMPAPG